MGRLRRLTPVMSGLRPRLGSLATDRAASERARDRERDAQPWRRWYKTARWQRLRWRVLVRDLFTCQCGCGVSEADTSQLVADHRTPHRGDEALFWNEGNLRTLRKPCHDSAKQREERRG